MRSAMWKQGVAGGLAQRASVAFVIVTTSLGCSSGGVARAARPQAPSAAHALDEPQAVDDAACHDVKRGARPLVVDWRPEQRGDLEVVMGDGIAVVHYTCEGLELLQDCSVQGSYGFKSIVLKQQLIRLETADELRANLPLSGVSLALQLKADFASGTTLDLATALVGNLTASRLTVERQDLVGQCEGATHFVRAANVGAFVMQTGERAKATSAAKIFSAGAEGGSQSSKLARTEDGQLAACMSAPTDAGKPPHNCGALVRLRLLPLSVAGASGPSVKEVQPETETACPEGLVLRDDKCTKEAAAVAHVCVPGNLADCEAQCSKNEMQSCARLARMLAVSDHPVSKARAAILLEKACGPDAPSACSDLAIVKLSSSNDPATSAEAARLVERACQLGEANGCFNLGNLFYEGRGVTVDKARAFALYEQACNAGKPAGCTNAGTMYDDGEGVKADPTRAFVLFRKACEGEQPAACANLAYMHAQGRGTPLDEAAATRLYERACGLGSAKACEYAGLRFERGLGTAADVSKAKQLFVQACKLGSKVACARSTL